MNKYIVICGMLVTFSASLLAQDLKMAKAGSPPPPSIVSVSPIINCGTSCTVTIPLIPSDVDEVKIIISDSEGNEDYSNTISVSGGETNWAHTSTTLDQDDDYTVKVQMTKNNTIIGASSDDDITVVGSYVNKITKLTDSDSTNDSDNQFVPADIVSALGLSSAVTSDLKANISDLNAQLESGNYPGCVKPTGNVSDSIVGTFLQCVMEAHYDDVLTANHNDNSSPSSTESADGSISVSIDSDLTAMCASTRWNCSITDTDTDGWEFSADFTTVLLSVSEVATATNSYANSLDSDFNVVVTINEYNVISADASSKTYSSTELPPAPVLTDLLDSSPAIVASDLEFLGLSSAVKNDIAANLSNLNTNLSDFIATDSCNDGTNTHTVSSSSSRAVVADYLECVMRDYFVDTIAAASVDTSHTPSETVCSASVVGDLPSYCGHPQWTCTLSNKSPSGWTLGTDGDGDPQVTADISSTSGSPISGSYRVTASLGIYSPAYSMSWDYNVNIPGGNPVTQTVRKNWSGDVLSAVNKCTSNNQRVATWAEVQAKEKPANCSSNFSSYPAHAYNCSGSFNSIPNGVYATDTTQSNPNCNSSWKTISWLKTYSSAVKSSRKARSNGSQTKMIAYDDGNFTTTNCRDGDLGSSGSVVWCVGSTYSCN